MALYRRARLRWADGELVATTRETNRSHEVWLAGLSGFYGGVGVRGTPAARLGHGTFPERRYRTGRTMTLTVGIALGSAAHRAVAARAASGLLWDGGAGSLEVLVDDLELSCVVEPDGEVSVLEVGGQSLSVQIPLHAPDPFLYGSGSQASVHQEGTGVGLLFPFLTGGRVSFGVAVPQVTSAGLTNRGNADAWPVLTVRGDLPSGFRVVHPGGVIEWHGPVTGSAPAVVVTRRHQVLISGSDQSRFLGRADWAPVRPGRSASYSLQPFQGSGTLDIELRSTYL